MKVVIADDSAPTRDVFVALLRALKHEIVGIAADGREAEELCRSQTPDVAIIDFNMGAHGGDIAAPAILKMGIPVLVVTSKASAQEWLKAQGIEFLPKPPHYGALKAKFEEMFPA